MIIKIKHTSKYGLLFKFEPNGIHVARLGSPTTYPSNNILNDNRETVAHVYTRAFQSCLVESDNKGVDMTHRFICVPNVRKSIMLSK